MTKWKLPKIYKQATASDLLTELVEKNTGTRGFSQRALAKKLGWPVSYIPDVISRRKAFTIARALELARYFETSTLDTERLILLAAQSQDPESSSMMARVIEAKAPKNEKATEDFQLLDFDVFIVFETIKFLRGEATEKSILDLLANTTLELPGLRKALQVLLQKEYVGKQGERYHAKKIHLATDDSGALELYNRLHQDFSRNYQRVIQASMAPWTLYSGVLQLDLERIPEIKEKFLSFRNWLTRMAEEDAKRPEVGANSLFQIDLNLMSLIKK